MTVKLELPADVQAGLLAQAEAEGLSLDQFLQRKLATILSPSPANFDPGNAEAWDRDLDLWLDAFPQGPALPEAALHREDWYPDRW